MSENSSITWEKFKENPDKPWDWDFLSMNPSITWEIIKENPRKEWNWTCLSMNPSITWENVKENPEKSWDWTELSLTPNINWKIVKDNPDKPWNWEGLSINNFNIRKVKAIVIIQRSFKRFEMLRQKHLSEIIEVGTEYFYSFGRGGYTELLLEWKKNGKVYL